MGKRVVVAMSGGIDSSVAAVLLKEQGHEVIGMTMCFSAKGGNLSDYNSKRPTCCGLQGIEDARKVAHSLGIKHYIINMQKALEEHIIKDFCHEYLRGKTPNPCVRCNKYIKFGILLKKTLALGARYLATGHYARIEKVQDYSLKKAKDKLKDQSYFLYNLGQNQLRHIIFPLGNYTKNEARTLARKFDLPVADKLASQEICFLPQHDYRSFLVSRVNAKIKPGLIIDKNGFVLGKHRGIAFYTIGQREGLGIAKGYPLYVVKIDPRNNRITVGSRADAYAKEFLVKNIRFVLRPMKKNVAVNVRIRYNHKEAPAKISPDNNKLRVCFERPQFAITAGQSAVFYEGDEILGGGIIYKVLG